MKICLKCGIEKPLDGFYERKKGTGKYKPDCKECYLKNQVSNRPFNSYRNKIACKKWRLNNLEKERERKRNYYWKDPDRWRGTKKEYNKVYFANRRANPTPQFLLSERLRDRLRKAIKGNYKSGSAVSDLGCSIGEFKLYIENQFEEGMTWNNYGKWHLDHVIPLSSFDLTNRMEFLEACNWLNIRPLWAIDNLRRRKKIQ
jgi:hypothetical protein